MEPALILGTYVISLAITESDGMWGVFAKVRMNTWIDEFGLLNCYICTSAWIAIILCIAFGRYDMILVSWGGSVVIYKLITAIMVR